MALTADRHTPYRDGDLVNTPVAASAKIFAGALILLDGGYAKPGESAAAKIAWGRAEEFCDNSSGAAGAKSVQVRRNQVFRWDNDTGAGALAQADVGADCYIKDDHTVSKTSTSRTVAGKLIEVDSDGVWVKM